MKYSLAWSEEAQRTFRKLDASIQRKIKNWLEKNIDGSENPRVHGTALSENLSGLWRYRVGDYRILCEIEDDICVVIIVQVGHRSKIYN